MPAILFGSISTLTDTSELQRQAFNEAFAEKGLDWRWEQRDYAEMLRDSGGADRVRTYAAERGEQVDATAVHAAKSRIFQRLLGSGSLQPRPGVLDTVAAANRNGVRLGLVTTTSPDNVEALAQGLRGVLEFSTFDVVLDNSQVETGKPDPAVYRVALSRMGETDESSVAIEDNLGGVAAATGAGIRCIAFPNQNTAGHDFGETTRVEALDPDALLLMVTKTATA